MHGEMDIRFRCYAARILCVPIAAKRIDEFAQERQDTKPRGPRSREPLRFVDHHQGELGLPIRNAYSRRSRCPQNYVPNLRPDEQFAMETFDCEIELPSAGTLSQCGGQFEIQGLFKHELPSVISVGNASGGSCLRLGYLVYANPGATRQFEGRANFGSALLEPAKVYSFDIAIPLAELKGQSSLVVGFLHEDRFWFSERGGPTLRFFAPAQWHSTRDRSIQSTGGVSGASILEQSIPLLGARTALSEVLTRSPRGCCGSHQGRRHQIWRHCSC
jgi:hypothetical protein